jgi:MarR family transcriptional regulator, organic hydroperoxide resistance regulator
MTTSVEGSLDQEIFDAVAGLITQLLAQAEAVAESYSVPVFCAKALHMLDASMAMKELGRRMKCDPSFVTAIADTLEKRGLATREPSAADRRIKNLVLSPEGLAVKQRLEADLLSRMPWTRVLDVAERECFLGLIRKMTEATEHAS